MPTNSDRRVRVTLAVCFFTAVAACILRLIQQYAGYDPMWMRWTIAVLLTVTAVSGVIAFAFATAHRPQ